MDGPVFERDLGGLFLGFGSLSDLKGVVAFAFGSLHQERDFLLVFW
jgi:hypothetical protein